MIEYPYTPAHAVDIQWRRRVHVFKELLPGFKWLTHFKAYWPSYEKWFLKEGDRQRPTYRDCRRMLQFYMPELMPVYEDLIDLAGGSDRVSRFLSLYKPTPFMTGCSQAIWPGDEPALIRNYDYSPHLWEANIVYTKYLKKKIIGMTDCAWGLLDGINEDGLVISLTFGGRRVVGDGFGVPLLVRYALETCETTTEVRELCSKIPVNMAYNLSVVDAYGEEMTAYLAPDRPPVFRRWPISTNHQDRVDWREYVEMTGSVEREKLLAAQLGDPTMTFEAFSALFLYPPLFRRDFDRAYGTLYTAIYYPQNRSSTFVWPGKALPLSFDTFQECDFEVIYT